MNELNKPKLVFFRWKSDGIPEYLQLHRQQHLKCLSEFFEVTEIHDDCDYQEILDRYQPDLTLFESGASAVKFSNKIKIQNTSTHPNVPKLGFHNGDSFCGSRSTFIADMDRWGIETFFSINVSMAEYTPEISENLFVWPNFIDSDLYRDYNESKLIPVLFTGSQAAHYPWRQKIHKLISQYYPSLTCPHFGWTNDRITSRMIYGEQYARMINASWFVPSCGTVSKELVRKIFEIPASKSCLITEKSSAVLAAGFVDMQNCIFADENDVLDKLEYLFQNLDKLEEVINAGYQLVHSKHSLKQRNQIFQWYNLYKQLKPSQKIVQTNPFEPITIVEKSSEIKNSHIINNGLDRVLLRQGDEKLLLSKYDEAEALYIRCLHYIPYLVEPKLRLALCNLYKGNANAAIQWIYPQIQHVLEIEQALEPDPVEWAYLIVAILCQGKLDKAIKYTNQFPSLSHPELERIRWAINVLKDRDNKCILPHEQLKYRYSVHHLPHQNFNNWVDNLCVMLKACQQLKWAETLSQSLKQQQINSIDNSIVLRKSPKRMFECWFNTRLIFLENKHSLKLENTQFFRKLVGKLKARAIRSLHYLEAKYGCFLPYRLSEMKNDGFYCSIENLTAKENIKTALIIGASAGEGSTEASLTGIKKNQNNPTVVCLNTSTPQYMKLQKRHANNSRIEFYNTLSTSLEESSSDFENIINKIKQDNKISSFDLVLIDNGFTVSVDLDIVDGAKFFLLEDINTFQGHKNCSRLLTDRNYILVDRNPTLRKGYAIFHRLNAK